MKKHSEAMRAFIDRITQAGFTPHAEESEPTYERRYTLGRVCRITFYEEAAVTRFSFKLRDEPEFTTTTIPDVFPASAVLTFFEQLHSELGRV